MATPSHSAPASGPTALLMGGWQSEKSHLHGTLLLGGCIDNDCRLHLKDIPKDKDHREEAHAKKSAAAA
jgi:hypothetical protein